MRRGPDLHRSQAMPSLSRSIFEFALYQANDRCGANLAVPDARLSLAPGLPTPPLNCFCIAVQLAKVLTAASAGDERPATEKSPIQPMAMIFFTCSPTVFVVFG